MWRRDKQVLKSVCQTIAYPLSFLLHLWKRQKDDEHTQASRIPSDNFPTFSLKADGYCGALMIAYSCIFLCGWNFAAPTATEQILWRVSSIAMLAFTFPCGLVGFYIEYRYFDDWKKRDGGGATGRFVGWFFRLLRLPLNPVPLQAHSGTEATEEGKSIRRASGTGIQTMPMWANVFCVSISIIYCAARGFILIEDFAGLRKLPKEIYETTQWSPYLPQM